jgi:hypothetical protein
MEDESRTAAGLTAHMGVIAEALGTDEDTTELADGIEVHTVGPVILVVARDDGAGAMVEAMTTEEARTFAGLLLSAIQQAQENGG